jgi:glutamine amidotransferase
MVGDGKVAIVDYNMGNIQSISNALSVVTDDVEVVSEGGEVGDPDAVVVPGVGAFADGMNNFEARGFSEPLTELVVDGETPLLGICLGMQFLAERSEEHGTHPGLGWVAAEVERIEPAEDGYRVPHMGWNDVEVPADADSVLFRDFESAGTFYFVHSYHLDPRTLDGSLTTGRSWHGTEVTAAIRQDNIFGVQFHPEKSQGAGLKILENFTRYAGRGDGTW